MHAIYFLADENLADLASAAALQMSLHWDCDFHIFIERRDLTSQIHEVGEGRITYHYEELGKFLPAGLPEVDHWPSIVYLRFFAPRALSNYKRVLYLDADILAFGADNSLWDAPLPYGVGAVDDLATLRSGQEGMDRGAWLREIGVQSGRYANGGLLLIDPEIWNKIDFGTLLPSYFRKHPKAKLQDQDFLAHYFDGRWTVLSPRFNWQSGVLNLGLTQAVAPIFVHFCTGLRPWHGPQLSWISPADPTYISIYQQVMNYAGFSPEQYYKSYPLSALRRMKFAFRAWTSRHGRHSRAEGKSRSRWMEHHIFLRDYINEGLSEEKFAVDQRKKLELTDPEPFWDGRFIRVKDDLPPGDALARISVPPVIVS